MAILAFQKPDKVVMLEAINTIRISGVEHEFSSVPGVKEDVTNIILNLKQVRFKQVVEEFENEKVSITVENSTEFKAGDIGKYLRARR